MSTASFSAIILPESLVTARFSDCDPFGHLNNARYIDYFLNAREDHLAQFYDFRLFQHVQQNQAGWVVSHTEISYVRPVKAAEEVVIRTGVIHFSDSLLAIEGAMLDRETRKLKTLCWIEFTYISFQTTRTFSHPDELKHLFGSLQLDPAIFAAGFLNRVKVLRQSTTNATSPE